MIPGFMCLQFRRAKIHIHLHSPYSAFPGNLLRRKLSRGFGETSQSGGSYESKLARDYVDLRPIGGGPGGGGRGAGRGDRVTAHGGGKQREHDRSCPYNKWKNRRHTRRRYQRNRDRCWRARSEEHTSELQSRL